MSGRYEARHFMNGFDNSDVYLNNLLAYILNMHGNHYKRFGPTHLVGVGRDWEEAVDERGPGRRLSVRASHRGQIFGA